MQVKISTEKISTEIHYIGDRKYLVAYVSGMVSMARMVDEDTFVLIGTFKIKK